MAAPFCLKKDQVDAFKGALKDKTIDIEKMADMSSNARREFLGKIVGPENAKDVNTLFESKLLLKNVQQGMVNWAKKVAGMSPKARRDVQSQIEKLSKVLTPTDEKAFLRDLAAQKLGVSVSYDEVKQIAQHSENLKKLSATKDQFGNPTPEYFKELRATKKYIQSLNEGSIPSQLVSVARNFLLTRVSTPLKVTTEQTINQGIEAIARSIAYGRDAAVPPSLLKAAWDYTKNAMKVYHQTDYNQAAMNSLDEGNMFGDVFSHHEGTSSVFKGSIGERARGALRQGAKGLDRVVIHYLHGEGFNAQFNAAFAHTAMLEGLKQARSEGLKGQEVTDRATELFKQSTTIGTTDPIASKIRGQAQQDAMRVTNTNETIGSNWSKFAKNMLNKVSGPIRLGDWTVPFSKIPGSIFSNAVDVAGGGLAKAGWQFKQAVTDAKTTGKLDLTQPVRTLVRTVGLMGASALIASYIKPDDYDEKRGMVKFGKYWVSTELLGPAGPAITGFIEARDAPPDTKYPWMNKYGGLPNKLAAYGTGVLKGAKRLPLINEAYEIRDYGFLDFLKNFVTSRVAPGVITDAYKAYEAGNPLPVVAGAKVKTQAQIDASGKPEPISKQVQSGKMSINDGKKALQDKFKSGEITKGQAQDELGRLAVPKVVQDAKDMDAANDDDFTKMENFLSNLSDEDKKKVLPAIVKKAQNKMADGSPKATADAQRLWALRMKYFPQSPKAQAATK